MSANEERFQRIVLSVVYTVALVYYAGYFIRELLPSSFTNDVLAKPFCFVGEKVLYSTIVISLLGRELIAEFSPMLSIKTALDLARGYVTKWRQTDHSTSTKKLLDKRSGICYSGITPQPISDSGLTTPDH